MHCLEGLRDSLHSTDEVFININDCVCFTCQLGLDKPAQSLTMVRIRTLLCCAGRRLMPEIMMIQEEIGLSTMMGGGWDEMVFAVTIIV